MRPTREDLHRAVENAPELFEERIIEAFDDDWWNKAQHFIEETIWEQNGSVNIFRVEGTTHPGCQKMTWGDFLRMGKRMEDNLERMEDNPDYYLQDVPRSPGIFFRRVDGGPWFVTKDGKHRTCIAKALFLLWERTSLHGVTLTEHVLDHESMRLAERLKSRGHEVKVERRPVAREDGPGWRRDLFRVEVFVRTAGGVFEPASATRIRSRRRFFFPRGFRVGSRGFTPMKDRSPS